MSLDQIIKDDPFVTLATVAAGAGAVVAGIMTYFAAEGVKQARTSADVAAALVAQKSEASLAALRAELAAADERFARIDRDVGGAPAPLDISKLTISAQAALNLPTARFATFDDGSFFLDLPHRPDWRHQTMRESEMVRESLEIDEAYRPQPGPVDLSTNVWSQSDALVFATEIAAGDGTVQPMRFILRPRIVLQRVDGASANAIVAGALNGPPAAGGGAPVAPALPAQGSPAATTSAQIAGSLEVLLRGKLPIVLLMNSAVQSIQREANFPGTTVSVRTIRQVGNVLYTRLETRFPSSAGGGAFLLAEEFFVGVADGGYFIQTQLPTRTGLSPHAGYIQQWLAGLRLPEVPPDSRAYS